MIGVHVLKNILIPIVTVIGLEFGSLIAFADRHRERVRLARHGQAAHRFDQRARPAGDRRLPAGDRDCCSSSSTCVVDILYSVLDPRVRLAAKGMSARPLPTTSPPRRRDARDAVRAASSRDFVANPHRASSASRCSSLIVLRRDLRAAGSRRRTPTTSRSSTSWTAACRRARSRPTGCTYLARHRRPGPRHAVGDLLRPAHLARRRRRLSTVLALRHRRSRSGLLAAYFGGRVDDADHAHRRPPAVVSRRS